MIQLQTSLQLSLNWHIKIINSQLKHMHHIVMDTFKTKQCEQHHSLLQAPHFLNCQFFHSKEDKRRNPLEKKDAQLTLAYSADYLENFYSSAMCANFIEYLYHPHIYKTVQCQQTLKNLSSQYAKLHSMIGANDLICPKYCPFIHDNEQQFQPYLTFCRELKGEKDDTFKIDRIRSIVDEIKNITAPVPNLTHKNQQEISNIKNILRKKAKELPNTIVNPKNAGKAQNFGSEMQNFPSALNNLKSEHEHFHYDYYNYFFHSERLPIIEDRHHEFKNYKDITASDVVPMVMKYIAAFLNSEGGVLYIGIDDSSVVYGLRINQNEFDKFLLQVDRLGKFNLQPPLMPQKYSVRRIPVYQDKKNRELWVVEVKVTPTHKDKKNKQLTLFNRDCFMRMNASTHRLDALDIFQYVRLNEEEKSEKIDQLQVIQALQKYIDKKGNTMLTADLEEMRNEMGKLLEKTNTLILEKRKKES